MGEPALEQAVEQPAEPARYWVALHECLADGTCGNKWNAFWVTEEEMIRDFTFDKEFLDGAKFGLIVAGQHLFGDFLRVVKVPAYLAIYSGGQDDATLEKKWNGE